MCCLAIVCNDAKLFFVIQEEGVKEGVDDLTNIRVGVDNEASFTVKKGLFSQEFTVQRDGECYLSADCVFTHYLE